MGTNIDQKFKEQTRWLPNSAFQTYYGKPAFENYGRANVTPLFGGTVYGQYMASHNINPHKQPNNPKYKQVYQSAEIGNQKLQAVKRYYGRTSDHMPRKCKDEYQQSQVRYYTCFSILMIQLERSKAG